MAGLDELDFDYATSVAQQAQGLMAQHRVPPTPDNFAVWFKFALGTSPQLKAAMDACSDLRQGAGRILIGG